MTFGVLKCLLVLVSSRNSYSLRHSDASILSIRSYRRLYLTRSDLGYINRNTLRTHWRIVENTNAFPKDPSDKAQSFFSPHSFIEKFTFSPQAEVLTIGLIILLKSLLAHFRDSRSKLCSTSLFIAFSSFYHTSLTFEPTSLNVDQVLPLSLWLGSSIFDTSYFPFLPSLVGHSITKIPGRFDQCVLVKPIWEILKNEVAGNCDLLFFGCIQGVPNNLFYTV